MKLTKAQRLFMKAGIADIRLRANEKAFRQFCAEAKDNPAAWAGITREIKQLRRTRKNLIRAALDAARSENTEHYMNGINEVLRLIGR